jgi:hypothetical protein
MVHDELRLCDLERLFHLENDCSFTCNWFLSGNNELNSIKLLSDVMVLGKLRQTLSLVRFFMCFQ